MLLEKLQGAIPGQLGVFRVVTAGRVVVKSVIGIGIHMHGVIASIGFQIGFIFGPTAIDPPIQFSQLNQQRRLDVLAQLLGRRRSVEGYTGIQGIGNDRRQHIDHVAAETEPDRP